VNGTNAITTLEAFALANFANKYQTSAVSFISSPEMEPTSQQYPVSADIFRNIFRVRSKDIRSQTTFFFRRMIPWYLVVGSTSFDAK